MSNYTKTTNFASKDNLSPGNPLKIVKGTEIDTEFNNIQTAVATKTDNASAAITGGSITGITDLAVADGGTGASTATAALNNLLPTQTGNANKYLQTDGTNATWDAVSLSTSDITGTLPVANGGTGVTSSTGTGSVVLSNSPTLVTPALGTPASGVATNLTGLPISTGVSGLGTGVATFLGTPSSANLASAVTDETGSGALVFANSPTLVTPALGTPASATLTNATGLPISTGVSGLGTGVATFLATPSSANLASAVSDETGSGALVFANSPTLVTPALGTPSALVGTNITGTASGLTAGNVTTNANLTGAVTSVGNATSLGSFSSANLLGALTDETGTGSAVFATSPTLVTPILGTPTSATLTNATGLPIATGVSGLGTGVATALAVNVGSSGAPLVNGGVLGTPSSGTATNLTGLPLSTGVTGTLPTANGGTNLTSFTSGGVVYASSTSALATGSNLYFDGTNLGVGVTSPSQKLELAGVLRVKNGNADTNGLNLSSDAAGVSTINSGYAGAGQIVFQTEGTERMRLTSTGLGIGTTSATAKLTVINTADANKQIVFGDSATYYGSVGHNSGTGLNEYRTEPSGGHGFFIGTSGTANMTLNSSGNLGIGTSSPVARNHIRGSGTSGQVTASWILENLSSGTAGMDITGSAGSSYLRFLYGGGAGTGTNTLTETMRIGLEGASVGVQQIKFAATQVASSDANTLDDYEEGTWTPAFSTWTTAPSSVVASYTKIGRQVTLNIVAFAGVCSAGSTITGIPFSASSNGPASVLCTTDASVVGFTALVFDNASQISHVSTTAMSGRYWTCSFTYQTN